MDIFTAVQVLELSSYSGPEDLKRAFRAVAHRCHPDKNPGRDTGAEFRRALEAYRHCLGHLEELSRHFGARYDAADEAVSKVLVENLDDIFEDIFGFGRQGRALGYEEPQALELSLGELFRGGEVVRRLSVPRSCAACRGSGAAQGGVARVCRQCFGKGAYRVGGRPEAGPRLCPQCGGRGREIERPCPDCAGFGRVKRPGRWILEVPRGLAAGELRSLGARERRNGPVLEVLVRVRPRSDPIFQIEKYDLMCEYRLDFSRRRRDSSYIMRAPWGEVRVPVAPAAQPGDMVVIAGQGLYKGAAGSARGDMKVTLRQKEPGFWRRLWGGLFEKS